MPKATRSSAFRQFPKWSPRNRDRRTRLPDRRGRRHNRNDGAIERARDEPGPVGRKFVSDERHHNITQTALVLVDDVESVWIRDEGSTNGTLLNDEGDPAHRAVELPTAMASSWEPIWSSSWSGSTRLTNDSSARCLNGMWRDPLTGLYNRAIFSIKSACWPNEAPPREPAWRC